MNNIALITIATAVLLGTALAAYEWNCMQTANAQSAAESSDACCPTDPERADDTSVQLIERVTGVPESVAAMCTISDPTVLKGRGEITRELFNSAASTKTTEHGYAFAFDRSRAHEVFDYANFESDCCGFLRFTLTFEEGGGPVWLAVETASEHRPILDEMFATFVQSAGD